MGLLEGRATLLVGLLGVAVAGAIMTAQEMRNVAKE
jgi:hypothetical protein